MRGGGGGLLPYISHIDMCRPNGYHFQAFLVWNRVSICRFGLGEGMISSIHYESQLDRKNILFEN